MKKNLFLIIALMLLISVGNNTLAQWAEYQAPANNISCMAMNEGKILLFAENCYYVAGLPAKPLIWSQMPVPGNGPITAGLIMSDDKVFALRPNGDLWILENTVWSVFFPNISGVSGVKENEFFFYSGNIIFHYANGEVEQAPFFENIKSIAFNNSNIMVFGEDKIYSGPDIHSLQLVQSLNNFVPIEAAMSEEEYVFVGAATGGLAAWHQAQIEQCALFTHVLTRGTLNSVAFSADTAFVGGVIGNKGVLFNTLDMSSLLILPKPILSVRANEAYVAAVSSDKLYLKEKTVETSLSSATSAISQLTLITNPVQNGILRINASREMSAIISDLSGRQMKSLLLKKGLNEINVSGLVAGVYLCEGLKIVIP